MASDRDLDGRLEGVRVELVRARVDAPLGRAARERRVVAGDEGDDRPAREGADLLDERERVLVVLVHDHDRQVGVLPGDGLRRLGQVDRRRGDRVAEALENRRRARERVAILVCREDAKACGDLIRVLAHEPGPYPDRGPYTRTRPRPSTPPRTRLARPSAPAPSQHHDAARRRTRPRGTPPVRGARPYPRPPYAGADRRALPAAGPPARPPLPAAGGAAGGPAPGRLRRPRQGDRPLRRDARRRVLLLRRPDDPRGDQAP